MAAEPITPMLDLARSRTTPATVPCQQANIDLHSSPLSSNDPTKPQPIRIWPRSSSPTPASLPPISRRLVRSPLAAPSDHEQLTAQPTSAAAHSISLIQHLATSITIQQRSQAAGPHRLHHERPPNPAAPISPSVTADDLAATIDPSRTQQPHPTPLPALSIRPSTTSHLPITSQQQPAKTPNSYHFANN
ncbi:hypothetical protein ACLOJK_020630 [Asimina triloba]